MSPSFAPSSMNAAITSVYIVIAVCTPWIVVSRSSTICEIATFMTLESRTITNCAEARMSMGSHLRIVADAHLTANDDGNRLRLDPALEERDLVEPGEVLAQAARLAG